MSMDKDMNSKNKRLREKSYNNNSKTIKNNDIDNRIKKIIKTFDKIRIYHPITVLEIWLFTITLGAIAISGLFLIRDWLFSNFGIYGKIYIPTPKITLDIHIWFGFLLIIIGLFHVVFHFLLKNQKDILPKRTSSDFKSFLHSGMYLIGLARRENYEESSKFNGRQRIVYAALVYILGLSIISGVIYYFNFILDDLLIVHIIPSGLSIMVLLFHVLITIRNHDLISLKAAFFTGTLPIWYIRKKYKIWYKKLISEQKNRFQKQITKNYSNKELSKQKNDLSNAISKFFHLIDENIDEKQLNIISNKIKKSYDSVELNRIIELSNQFD